MTEFIPNEGKELQSTVDGESYLRIPIKTRIINEDDDMMDLIEEYIKPHLQPGDLLFISEKVLCVTQGRFVAVEGMKTSWLATFLSKHVRNHAGTDKFRGYGHGTPYAMQLLIDEAGVVRTVFAAAAAVVTRPFGIKGAFYYLVGKLAKSIDYPMSYTIEKYKTMAKQAPLKPGKVARAIKDKFGVETVIIDANYLGVVSLGQSAGAPSEKFMYKLLKDNPAGQDSEMTPFIIARKV